MNVWLWILIIAVVLVVALLLAVGQRRRRTSTLRQHFGPEYERAVQTRDNRRAAEADLLSRERQRARLHIKPIPSNTRARFAQEWAMVQERFVDQPSTAVIAADGLLHQVMAERGYPVEDFEEQAGLISVDHPRVVENYRFAHATLERAQSQRASTEDLRQALVSYRALFDDLLEDTEAGVPAGADEPTAPWRAPETPGYTDPRYPQGG